MRMSGCAKSGVDKKILNAILLADENTLMRRVKCGSIQREGGCWKVLMRNHLKTTSEWPQSGPAAPLQPNEWFYKNKQGGTASNDDYPSLAVRSDCRGLFVSPGTQFQTRQNAPQGSYCFYQKGEDQI